MPWKVYSDDIKQKIADIYQSGKSQKYISELFEIEKSVISRIIQRFKIRNTVKTAARTGKTNSYYDNSMVRLVKQDPYISSNQIKIDLNLNLSARTISRRLVDHGLLSRRPNKKPMLSTKQRLARLKLARKYSSWDVNKWKTVLFSDESKFNFIDSDGMYHVRRPVGERLNPQYYKKLWNGETVNGGGSILMWGCFSTNGTGPLHKINGIMDRNVYKNIFENVMLP